MTIHSEEIHFMRCQQVGCLESYGYHIFESELIEDAKKEGWVLVEGMDEDKWYCPIHGLCLSKEGK